MRPYRTLLDDKSVLLAACASIVVGLGYVFVVNQNAKWAAYLFIAPFPLLLFYLYDNLHAKIAIIVGLLIFTEKILISQRQPVPFLTIGVTLIFVLVMLLSTVEFDTLGKLLQQRVFVLAMFMLTPLAAIIFSQGHGFGFFYEQVLNYQVYFVEFFLFFLMGFLAYRDPQKLDSFFFCMVVFGGLIAALHLYSLYTGINLEAIRGAGEVATNRDLTSEENWRYGGVFGNPNTMAAYYVMFAPIGLLMLNAPGNLCKKAMILGCLAMMLLSLFFAGSRGGLFFGAATFLMALGMLRIKTKGFITLIISVVLLAVFAKLTTETYFYEFFSRAIERFGEQGFDPGIRIEIWRASWRMLLDNPFGIGLYWEIYMNELSRYSLLYFANPHNIYLSIALFGGFAGLGCFLIILIRSIGKCLHVMRADTLELKQPAKYCLLAIAGFALFGITEPIFSNGYKINHIIALVIGISWALSMVCDEAAAISTADPD